MDPNHQGASNSISDSLKLDGGISTYFERPIMSVSRRSFVAILAGAAFAPSANGQTGPEMTVYKDPNCGCCRAWVNHVRKAGFTVRIVESDAMDMIKKQYGIPDALASCHTAEISGYVIEGHVPAAEIARLLKERPAGKGLAVAGMPVNSPGMEVRGAADEQYDVMLFSDVGQAKRFAVYRGAMLVG